MHAKPNSQLHAASHCQATYSRVISIVVHDTAAEACVLSNDTAYNTGVFWSLYASTPAFSEEDYYYGQSPIYIIQSCISPSDAVVEEGSGRVCGMHGVLCGPSAPRSGSSLHIYIVLYTVFIIIYNYRDCCMLYIISLWCVYNIYACLLATGLNSCRDFPNLDFGESGCEGFLEVVVVIDPGLPQGSQCPWSSSQCYR